MTEECTLIATALPNPENPGDMKTYLEGVGPLLTAHGGGPARRLKVTEVVNGDPAAIVMVMDFPAKENLATLFASDEYKALIPARDRGFKTMNIWIAGAM